MHKLAIALAIGLAASAPALAKDKKPADPNKKVCRPDAASTGSIMPRTICHTAAEWAQIDGTVNGSSTGDLRGQGAGRAARFPAGGN